MVNLSRFGFQRFLSVNRIYRELFCAFFYVQNLLTKSLGSVIVPPYLERRTEVAMKLIHRIANRFYYYYSYFTEVIAICDAHIRIYAWFGAVQIFKQLTVTEFCRVDHKSMRFFVLPRMGCVTHLLRPGNNIFVWKEKWRSKKWKTRNSLPLPLQ